MSGDTFVAYFSAHGILENGELVILWDNTRFDHIVGTGLWAPDLLRALAYCRASSKLIILDCCKAGGVVREPGMREGAPPEEFKQVIHPPRECLFLVASDHLQRARELEEIGGGFLAMKFCEALTTSFHAIPKRSPRTLLLDDFRDWVRSEARSHNLRAPDKYVPEPYVFGRSEEGFVLASHDDMPPVEVEWPNQTTMVVLPHKPHRGRALVLAKYPVSNRQYREFVLECQHSLPLGEMFRVDGDTRRWEGPFSPWLDEAFNHPEQPVVCVSCEDAIAYAQFVNLELRRTELTAHCRLPTPAMWVFGALGEMGSFRKAVLDPAAALHEVSCEFHHESQHPAILETVAKSGRRTNRYGFSDMIGNVWEWCYTDSQGFAELARVASIAATTHEYKKAEVIGGGFLDDLRSVRLRMSARELEHGSATSHSDLGFRIAGVHPVKDLPQDVQEYLEECIRIPDLLEFFRQV